MMAEHLDDLWVVAMVDSLVEQKVEHLADSMAGAMVDLKVICSVVMTVDHLENVSDILMA